jgi:hypothetical protein
VGDAWVLVRDGKELARYKDLGTLVYSPDGAHLAFQAKVGDGFDMMVDGAAVAHAPADYRMQVFDASSSRLIMDEPVVADYSRCRTIVYDLTTRRSTVIDANSLGTFVSADGTRVAVGEALEGGMRTLTFDPERPDAIHRGSTWEKIAAIDFGPAGFPLAYFGMRQGQSFLVVEDQEIPLSPGEQIVGGASPRRGERGFGALVRSGESVAFRYFLTDPGPPEPAFDDATGVVFGPVGRDHAYVARRGELWFVVANGKAGPPFESVRSPEFSPDGKVLVYRARRGGQRFVVLADREGKTLRELPAYDQVMDVHFTADGRSIAYGVKDGSRLAWKVEPL